MTPVQFLSPALAEFADATNYNNDRSLEAAAGFLDALDHAMNLLAPTLNSVALRV